MGKWPNAKCNGAEALLDAAANRPARCQLMSRPTAQ